jgi:hypothetical protein
MGIKGEGEVSGDLGLRLFIIIDSSIIIGVAYTPPGMKSIITPINNGTHHVFEVWAFWDSLLGIRGL